MTSISLAQSRPPSLHLHTPRPIHSRSSSQLSSVQVQQGQNIGHKNDDGDDDDDDDIEVVNERPAKRRRTSAKFTVKSLDTASSHITSSAGIYLGVPWSKVVRVTADAPAEEGTSVSLPPLPDRPRSATSGENVLQDSRPLVRVRKNFDVPNTPDHIPIPSKAPLFEQERRADYFPWTGKHPEDVLSEAHVRQGFFDRPPNPPDKELHTARAPLYHALKHKSGLDSLSAIFSMVLEAKQKHGTFSSTSSFKGPPPRVTLTEVKRKSWISDLANPDVAIRRLSKTIPQGIRGPVLLEQCLHSQIPLSRAIWFIKCVGANEIRTLKRKGVNPAVSQGAELKWLREWTMNVAHFLDAVTAQGGHENWTGKTRYSIVLVVRLYLENLLDRDHYLDWIIKSFSTASAAQWPFWMMLIRLFQKDLIAFRKRGKNLAEVLVLKHNAARSDSDGTFQPLVSNLASATKYLVKQRPGCFFMPDQWSECREALSFVLDLDNELEYQIMQQCKLANERALGAFKQSGTVMASPVEQVVEILDSFCLSKSVVEIAELLNKVCPDHDSLMVECFKWAVSKYRTGTTRIYFVARLFRKLRKQAHHTDDILLNLLFNQIQIADVDTRALKHLISELSRSNSFPLSRYMQWLSVRGLPSANSVSQTMLSFDRKNLNDTVVVQECGDPQQLLTEICLVNIEDHLLNFRNSLLNRAGFDEDIETGTFECLRDAISNALYKPDGLYAQQCWTGFRLDQLPWTIKTRLSYWLRGEMAALSKAPTIEATGKPPLPGVRSLTLERFQVVRDVVESAGDIAILADVLRITSSSRQEDILAAAVDTINMHCLPLAAIGALRPLQMIYGQLYVALRPIKTTMPLYATALIKLCQQYPVKSAPVQALQQDLIRGDRGRAVTACSPFSDGIAESLQQAGATFHDDFEAILQTESNLNQETTIRLFKVLIERIEKSQYHEGAQTQLLTLCQLLARLKLCQKLQGEALVRDWIVGLCSSQNQAMSSHLLFGLVCTQCVQLAEILDICQQSSARSLPRLHLFGHIRLAMLNEPETAIDPSLAYGFKLSVSKLIATRSAELLDVLGSEESSRSCAAPVKSSLVAVAMLNSEVIKALSKPAWFIVSQVLSEHLNVINIADSLDVQARTLAALAGPLSLPYCSLRMRMLCQNAAAKNDDAVQENIAATLCATAADPASPLFTSPRTFQVLLRSAGPALGAKVRSNIEQSFFDALPKFLQSKGAATLTIPTPEETEHASRALQQVMLATADTTVSVQPNGVSALVEKLTIYMKSLAISLSGPPVTSASSPASTPAATAPAENQFHNFLVASLDHLNLLLQMLCIKRAVFHPVNVPSSPAAAKALQQDHIKLVGLLITIGTHGVWTPLLTSTRERTRQARIKGLIDFVFDVAATLVDDMSDESRTFCARILKDKVKDERVQWLLGSVNTFGSMQGPEVGHGYQVIHDAKGVLGDWKPKVWEMLESSSSGDCCFGLGLFGARRP